MDESIKIIIGTISGFIIAFFAEPVKNYFENKSKLHYLRIALYKELMQNSIMLEHTLIESQSDKSSNIMIGQPLLINDCYTYVISKETALYYQLKETRVINMFYKLIDMIIKIPDGEEKYRTVLARDLIEGAVGLVQGSLDIGILDKKLAQRVTSKQEVEDILNRLGKKAK